MTPLAFRITKELTLPIKQRSFNDRGGLLRQMADIHCFEVSEVTPLVRDMCRSIAGRGAIDLRSMFLPAPRTWIEWRTAKGRAGKLFVESGSKGSVTIYGASSPERSGGFGGTLPFEGTLDYSSDLGMAPLWYRRFYAEKDGAEWNAALLAIINTPRIIGRRQHMPHRGLERRLISLRGIVGKFPLHAWTEIKLEVTKPKDASGEGDHEAHYTGERALHFCRSHIRIRLGRLEIVRGHWRGDASLGIKQSRYKLVAGERIQTSSEEDAA